MGKIAPPPRKDLLDGRLFNPRRIALRLHEDIAFRVLAANNTPDFRTISDFRKDHLVRHRSWAEVCWATGAAEWCPAYLMTSDASGWRRSAQRNFTDPESRIMPAPGGRDFIQGYNCQAQRYGCRRFRVREGVW